MTTAQGYGPMRDPEGELTPRGKRNARLMIMFKAFGINREGRLELARHILGRDDHLLTSFSDLDDEDQQRMLDAMTGATLVAHLCLERRAGLPRCPQCGRR